MHLRGAVLLRKIKYEAHVRRPECIERLVIIAYYPERDVSANEAIDQLDLSRVHILLLVAEQMVVGVCEDGPIIRVVVDCADHKRHHVGKVNCACTLQRLLVDAEKGDRVDKNFVILIYLGGEALGIQEPLFRARNKVQNVRFLIPPHLARVEDVPLLGRIPELKIFRKASELRISSELSKCKAMKGCDREIACRCKIERLPNARFHLVSRFLGKRQCENALAIHPLLHEVNESAGERRGFARAGPSQNQLMAPGGRGCGHLRRIEPIGAHARGTISVRRARLSASHCSARMRGPLLIVPSVNAASAASMDTRIREMTSCSAASPPRCESVEESTIPRNKAICSSEIPGDGK